MMDKSQSNDFNKAIKQLKDDFIAKLAIEFDNIEQLKNKLQVGQDGLHELKELHDIFHRLAGSCGTFGLSALGTHAKNLETSLKQKISEKSRIIIADDIEEIGTILQALKSLDDLADETVSFEVQRLNQNGLDQDGVRIWLIEDDQILAKELKRQFDSFGYHTRIFTSLQSAETAANTDQTDVILLDVMFEKDNVNASEEFANCRNLMNQNSVIVFMSAYDDFDSRVRAVQLDAQGYFLKPVSVPAIVNHLTRVFEVSDIPDARILIVDDDEELANHFRVVLNAAGYDSKCLFEPQHIIDVLNNFNPELILMDLHMPNYNGMEIAGVIRQHPKWTGLPIVYLSAVTDIEEQAKALEKGAEDFLSKPIHDIQLIATVKARIIRTRQLDEKISRDSLTGLLKHGVIKEAVNQEIKRAQRENATCSIAMIDIDNFKLVNDSYGHAVGDLVITAIASVLQRRLRKTDIIGRYGGEEFVAILPNCSAKKTFEILNEIRESFSQVDFTHNNKLFNCTFSAGVACSKMFPKYDGDALLIAADNSLYKSKNSGRNQINIASESSEIK